MRLGFFTACLPSLDLAAIAKWAAAEGFAALEVAAWPAEDPRAHAVTHVDARRLDERTVRELRALAQDHDLHLSSLGYYENNLHPDAARRSAAHEHLRALIDAAARLGVPTVGTFVGRDVTRSVADNLAMAPDVFAPLLESARECGVRLVVENCLMTSWHPDGYPANLAYSPELWDWVIGLGLGLNYDPSHLVGIGIDPVRALAPYVGHVAHVQAKDVEAMPGRLDRYGFYGRALDRTDPAQRNWWRYRLPGLGQVDWDGVLTTLRNGGFDGTVSIEHEDPVYDGSVEQVQQGLTLARDQLSPLLTRRDGTARQDVRRSKSGRRGPVEAHALGRR